MLTAGPFEDVKRVIDQLSVLEDVSGASCDDNQLGSNENSIGMLAAWLACCQNAKTAKLNENYICVLASSYKADGEMVGASGVDVAGYVKAASTGNAAVNQVSGEHGLGLRVLELGVEVPHDLADDWSEIDCTKSIAFGMEAAAAGGDLLGLSTLAPGNDAGVLAIIACCHSGTVQEWLAAVPEALRTPVYHKAYQMLAEFTEDDTVKLTALDALRAFGGREIAAAVGAMIAARSRNLPVVMDGWGALAAYAILQNLKVSAVAHVKLASADTALQDLVAQKLGVRPLVGAFVQDGAGCGVAISVSLLKSACALAR